MMDKFKIITNNVSQPTNKKHLSRTNTKFVNIKSNRNSIAAVFNKQYFRKSFTNKNAPFGSSLSQIFPKGKTTIANKSNYPIVDNEENEKIKRECDEPEITFTTIKNLEICHSKRINEHEICFAIDLITGKQGTVNKEDKKLLKLESKHSDNVSRRNFVFTKNSSLSTSELSKTDKKTSSCLYNLQYSRNTFQKANVLRYRENVFRAASRLTEEMPPFPDWTYIDEEFQYLDITRLNVGGQIFEIFDETLSNLIHTKLANCLKIHKSSGIPFFDRDYSCFNAIINFYRTGRLHLPSNVCHTFFEEELEFWGINEEFMEPCCRTEFEVYKKASNTLKKYGEDLNQEDIFNDVDRTVILTVRKKLYKIVTMGTGDILSRYFSALYVLFIILSILVMVISTTPYGRISISNTQSVKYSHRETISNFLSRTSVSENLHFSEIIICGFFFAEFICRFILCPTKLELLSDTLNWIDVLATTTTFLAYIFTKPESTGNFEGYMLLLKLPGIFRLFKLTTGLKTGINAFALTLRASAKELTLIFFILLIMTTIFGTLIFVTEMVNEKTLFESRSLFTDIYKGMWWAIVTMTSVGYGDFVPISTSGYLLASVTIMIGVMICQLPVPIVLKNFLVYNNQANARINHKVKFSVHCIDPESKANDEDVRNRYSQFKRSKTKFHKIFGKLYLNKVF